MSTLPSQRHLFDIPRDVSYLNCAYMAPQLLSVTAAGRAAVGGKERPWTVGPQDFFDASDRARALFAQIVGAPADDVALTPSVSYGLSLAAQALPIRAGERVLVLAEQFPSNVYPWRHAVERAGGGAAVVTVPRPAGDWTDAVLAALDDRVAVVALPNVHWTDGAALDLARVGDACRGLGAALVVDATQSVGAMPFDVALVRPDFLAVAAYKWLLGPYSAAFLYVDPRHHGAPPIEFNWMNRQRAADFASLVEYREGFAPGARRFDVGERSNFVLMPMVVAALEQVLAWGPQAIADTLAALTGRIAAGARDRGLRVLSPPARGPHMLGLRFPRGLPGDLAGRLAAQGIHVSVRGDSLRVSPHLYNDLADVDRLLAALVPRSGGGGGGGP